MREKDIARMLHEQGWLYNLKIGQLIVNDKDEDGRYVSNIYIPGVHEVLRELSYRENHILWLRYSQNKTLEDVAKELNLSKERIRQIESRCFRRLRQPKFITKVLAISESKHKEILNAKMATVEKEIRDFYDDKVTKRNDLLSKRFCETPLEELDLSIRPYNCLRRAGISTIEQLQEMTEEKLLRLRNLGRKSLYEIQSRLADIKPIGNSEMNTIDWFKKEFIPNASDETIATIIFLYQKYGNPDEMSENENTYIEALCEKYKHGGINEQIKL